MKCNYLLGCLIISSTPSFAAQLRTIGSQETLSLVKQCLSRRNSRTLQAQQKLISLLKSKEQLPTSAYDPIVTALEQHNSFPQLEEFASSITFGLKHLQETPGFIATLRTALSNLDNPDTAKGHLHEIDSAVKIAQDTGDEELLGLNVVKKTGTQKGKQFDIITSERWIECKDLNWAILRGAKQHRIKRQLLHQKKIVDAHNRIENQPVRYELHSKQPMPRTWQQWVQDHEIVVR